MSIYSDVIDHRINIITAGSAADQTLALQDTQSHFNLNKQKNISYLGRKTFGIQIRQIIQFSKQLLPNQTSYPSVSVLRSLCTIIKQWLLVGFIYYHVLLYIVAAQQE